MLVEKHAFDFCMYNQTVDTAVQRLLQGTPTFETRRKVRETEKAATMKRALAEFEGDLKKEWTLQEGQANAEFLESLRDEVDQLETSDKVGEEDLSSDEDFDDDLAGSCLLSGPSAAEPSLWAKSSFEPPRSLLDQYSAFKHKILLPDTYPDTILSQSRGKPFADELRNLMKTLSRREQSLPEEGDDKSPGRSDMESSLSDSNIRSTPRTPASRSVRARLRQVPYAANRHSARM
jgi:hypothetical protein